MTKPAELVEAEVVFGLCSRWGYKPEEALEAPVWVMRMTGVLAASEARRRELEPKADPNG